MIANLRVIDSSNLWLADEDGLDLHQFYLNDQTEDRSNIPYENRPPAGLYIHFPFCTHKCSYCDFYSLSYQADQVAAYCEALQREITEVAEDQTWRRIGSIYLGGGTPSLMKEIQLEALLSLIYTSFSVTLDCEITLEANPGTIGFNRLKAYREMGVNRISLGVQSFHESELQLLGRSHTCDQVFKAVDSLQSVGISNYGIDLIYGIPGQTMATWRQSLQEVVNLTPRHISCYLLQMDEMVPLALRIQDGEIESLSEEDEADMYYLAIHSLKRAGYLHYEISNFCQPGYASRHNLTYWEAGEYLGIGAGAVTFKGGQRYRNLPRIDQYSQSLLVKETSPPREILEVLVGLELAIDAMMMGLRTMRGINIEKFAERFRIDPMVIFGKAITESIKEGLLELNEPWLKLTPRGYFLSNRVFLRLMETGS